MEELEYPKWQKGQSHARFLELLQARDFNQVNVIVPEELRQLPEDKLRRLMLSDEEVKKYAIEGFTNQLAVVDAEADEIIGKQNSILDSLKERYQNELIPSAKELNEKTTEYNTEIEQFKAQMDELNDKRNMLSRDHVLKKVSDELNEHQQSTSQVVDKMISKEGILEEDELKTLIEEYTQKRTEWYQIKDKMDFVERNGVI